MKMGLITSAGLLVPKRGLSARWRNPREGIPDDNPVSPLTRAFVEPLPIMPIKQAVASLNPAPTVAPNTAGGEGRTRLHQALTLFPPQKLYRVVQKAAKVSMSPDLPVQTIWGFDGIIPAPPNSPGNGEPSPCRISKNRLRKKVGLGRRQAQPHFSTAI